MDKNRDIIMTCCESLGIEVKVFSKEYVYINRENFTEVDIRLIENHPTFTKKVENIFKGISRDNMDELMVGKKSGVYIIFDDENRFYYIGEAKNYLKRLKDHFKYGEIFADQMEKDLSKYRIYVLETKDDIHLRLALEGYLYYYLKKQAQVYGNNYCNDQLFLFREKNYKSYNKFIDGK